MIQHLGRYLHKKFSLKRGKDDSIDILEHVESNTHIEGANLWILLLAIIICSVGLNMDSPVIMIGAMLISPLMGPIIGMGVGLATYNMLLVWDGLRNFLVACILAVTVSGIYFLITPVREVTNEILLRTAPNFWDIIIASAGGLVGAIALTRKEKSYTVIPGVAIATTLMPPLAVSSFWFIQGELLIGMKALYLVFINSVYIIGTTFLIARLLRLPKKEYPDPMIKRKVLWLVYGLIIIAAIPALSMTADLIQTQRIDQQFQKLTSTVSNQYAVQILKKTLNSDTQELHLWVVGNYLSDQEQDAIRQSVATQYPLLQGYRLILQQGIDVDPNLGEDIVQPLLDHAIKTQSDQTLELIQQALQDYSKQVFQPQRVLKEAQSLEPSIEMIGFGTTGTDTTMMIQTDQGLTLERQGQIENWLRERVQMPQATIIWAKQYSDEVGTGDVEVIDF